MKCILWSNWHDIHAAHTDPFQDGSVHGHLWRVRIGARQDLANRQDVRELIDRCATFCRGLDHTDLGTVSTEDIALQAISVTGASLADVEEVGICTVCLEATP